MVEIKTNVEARDSRLSDAERQVLWKQDNGKSPVRGADRPMEREVTRGLCGVT